MSEQDKLEQEIAFGAEVAGFLTTNIARYIFDRAAENKEQAVALLIDVDPEDAKTIRKLQATITLNSTVGLWLQEAIQAAVDARDIIEAIE